MEGDRSVGSVAVLEGRVMDPAMVEPAQRHGIGEVGRPPGRPGTPMMQLAPGERPLAPVRGARDVGQTAGHALGLAEQSLRPAEIEHVGRAAEHRRRIDANAG